jgi:hypothetical protein
MYSDCCAPAQVGSPTYLAGTTPGHGARKGNPEPVYVGRQNVRVKATTAMSSPRLFRASTRPSLAATAGPHLSRASLVHFVQLEAGSPGLPRPHPVGHTSPGNGGNPPRG